MDLGVPIHLTGGCLQDFRLDALGEPQHVDRTVDARLRRLDRIELIVNGRGRASEVIDLVDLDVKRKGHVMAHQLEMRRAQKARNVVFGASEEVIDAENVASSFDQALAEM
jgi:hypothetical protein